MRRWSIRVWACTFRVVLTDRRVRVTIGRHALSFGWLFISYQRRVTRSTVPPALLIPYARAR